MRRPVFVQQSDPVHANARYDVAHRFETGQMPKRMDDEWHLHVFDLAGLLALIPPGLRVTHIEGVPFRWLPLRYIVRCESDDRGTRTMAEPEGSAVRVRRRTLQGVRLSPDVPVIVLLSLALALAGLRAQGNIASTLPRRDSSGT